MENHQLAALIILPIALIGTVANWTVAILIRKLKSMKNTFGRLTLSQSIGDALHSTTFLCYVVPMCYFNDQWMKNNSEYCGHFLIIVYEISTYSHLFISLNRFSAIMLPIKYDTIFSMTHTNMMIAFSWACAIFPSFYLYGYHDCKCFFIDENWMFTFSTTPICLKITWYADFLKNNSMIIFIVVIDIITVVKTRMLTKRLANSTISAKRSNEINFLKQACLQALVFLYELITYFIITPKIGAEKIVLIGMMANWTVAILITKLKSMKNTFGRLTLSQSIGDALHSTMFVFYVVPMIYLDNQWMKKNSKYCGHFLIIVYEISTYSHLFISLNRFSAIMLPIKYDTIFSMTHTNMMVAFSWAGTIIPSFYLYGYQDCKFYFIDEFWVFVFSTTPVCLKITWYADFLKYNSIVIVIVVIDIITVIKTRMLNKRLSTSTISTRRSNEINFLKQACLQAFVFLCELITYFILTPKIGAENRWLRFFLSTVAWVCVHMLDGIITLVFNNEFCKYIQSLMRKVIKVTPVSNYQSTTMRLSDNA